MSARHIHEKGVLSIGELIEKVKKDLDFKKAGAIAVFIGVVRGETSKGETVQKLEIEAYDEGANEVLSRICRDLKSRDGIVNVQIHHFVGEFSVGEDLVYVLVAGSHREDVFPVLREAVERYKKEAPIFKKEYITTIEGEGRAYWVSEAEG